MWTLEEYYVGMEDFIGNITFKVGDGSKISFGVTDFETHIFEHLQLLKPEGADSTTYPKVTRWRVGEGEREGGGIHGL